MRRSGVSDLDTARDSLQRRGLIEETPGTRSGRQPRPRYRATAAGLRDYKEYLVAQIGEDFRRSRLFARQLAAFAHDPELGLEIIERYGQACLQEAGDVPMPAADASLDTVSSLASRLVCEEGRLAMEAKLPWVEYARREFKALAGSALPQR